MADVLDLGNVIGPQGPKGDPGIRANPIFSTVTNLNYAPVGAIAGDLCLNAFTGNLTIGTKTIASGGLAKIITITPFVVEEAGNIKGIQGVQGIQGSITFTTSAAVATAPVGARIGDYVLNTGSSAVDIGGLNTVVGGYVKILTLDPFECVSAGSIRGPQGPQGPKGSDIYTVVAETTTAPTGSRVGDYILNSGTAAYAIGGVNTAIGGLVQITTLSPLACSAQGNLRGPTGPQGVQGPQGYNTYTVTGATSVAPSGSRVGDYILNSGTAAYAIGGVSTAIGGLVQITTLSPLACTAAGNIRGPQGPAGAAPTPMYAHYISIINAFFFILIINNNVALSRVGDFVQACFNFGFNSGESLPGYNTWSKNSIINSVVSAILDSRGLMILGMVQGSTNNYSQVEVAATSTSINDLVKRIA